MTFVDRLIEEPPYPQFMETPLIGDSQTILLKSDFAKLIQGLTQLSSLTVTVSDLFQNWIASANATSEKINNLAQNMAQIKEEWPNHLKTIETKMTDSFYAQLPPLAYPLEIDNSFFTHDTQTYTLNQTYEKCNPPPALYKLDPYREDGVPSMKLYSYPQFFFDEWKKRMLQEKKIRKVKRVTNMQVAEPANVKELELKKYGSSGEITMTKVKSSKFSLFKSNENSPTVATKKGDETPTLSASSLQSSEKLASATTPKAPKMVPSTGSTEMTPKQISMVKQQPTPPVEAEPEDPPQQSNLSAALQQVQLRKSQPIAMRAPTMIQTQTNEADTPPPAPLAPPPENVVSPASMGMTTTTTVESPSILLQHIRQRNAQLRKVEAGDRKAKPNSSEVSQLLMRRAVQEISDDDESDSDNNDEWD